MDPLTALTLLFAAALQIFCWALPVPRMARLPLATISGAMILYSLSAFALMGADAMRLAVPQWLAVLACVLVGGAASGLIGAYAWRNTRAGGSTPLLESVSIG